MAKQSSQKFIARNRAPRVQIEYDVELYGAEKKVQLPFVMGVMADLAGKPAEPLAPVADRKFLEVDVDNFDSRLKAMQPRVAFHVPNELTGEGNLSLDITFESMDDFKASAGDNMDRLQKMVGLAEQYEKRVKEEGELTKDQLKTRYVGKVDPKKHLEELGKIGIEENIVSALVEMVDKEASFCADVAKLAVEDEMTDA